MNPIANVLQAAHRTSLALFGGASDPLGKGRSLNVYWPTSTARDPAVSACRAIPCLDDGGRSREVDVGTMVVAEADRRKFRFARGLLPANGPRPAKTVIFYAGYSTAAASRYEVTAVSEFGGFIEVEAELLQRA